MSLRNAVAMSVFMVVAMSIGAQTIEIDFIPELGARGSVEGHIVWSGLNASNAGEYAVIAMLDTVWGQFVKPTYDNYLTAIDADGTFVINITSEGTDDHLVDNVIFYMIDRSEFGVVVDGSLVNNNYMANKYIAMLSVKRSTFWANSVSEPTPSVMPGFVLAGTTVTLSCVAGDTIRYTTDGTVPTTSSPVYATAFTVPPTGSLIIHAMTVRANGDTSRPSSFVYLPRQPLDKPFFGLNVSLILGSENPGGTLSEAVTRTRLQPVAPLTQWVRTFGTLNNGHEHINSIAKTEMGLKTLIGVWVSTDTGANAAQLNGLRNILQLGPAPDLIAVGNECSLIGVPAGILTNVIASVRGILAEYGLGASVPVGSVDVAGAGWLRSTLSQLDFVGVNIYSGTWDTTPQNQMAAAVAQSYTNETLRLGQRMVLLTETGAPHDGGTYTLPNNAGTQTASQPKSTAFLNAMLSWTRDARIPLFYFAAYDEAWKTRSTGNIIEQYFGLFDALGTLHPFYAPALNAHQPPVRINGIAVTPAAVSLSWQDGNANCAIRGKTNLADLAWVPLTGLNIGADGVQFTPSAYAFRFFCRTPLD